MQREVFFSFSSCYLMLFDFTPQTFFFYHGLDHHTHHCTHISKLKSLAQRDMIHRLSTMDCLIRVGCVTSCGTTPPNPLPPLTHTTPDPSNLMSFSESNSVSLSVRSDTANSYNLWCSSLQQKHCCRGLFSALLLFFNKGSQICSVIIQWY